MKTLPFVPKMPAGVDEEMPTRPAFEMVKSVLVAPAAVVEEIRKRFVPVSPGFAETANRAKGEVVPTPKFPVDDITKFAVPDAAVRTPKSAAAFRAYILNASLEDNPATEDPCFRFQVDMTSDLNKVIAGSVVLFVWMVSVLLALDVPTLMLPPLANERYGMKDV